MYRDIRLKHSAFPWRVTKIGFRTRSEAFFLCISDTPIPPPEQKKVSFPARKGIPTASRAEKCPKSCAKGTPEAFRAEKGIFSRAERDTNRLPSRKMPQFLRGRYLGGNPGRKRYLFLRGKGYQPPPEQKNATIPARKVPRRHSGQKKVSFPAQKGIPTASRAEKCHKSCAEECRMYNNSVNL